MALGSRKGRDVMTDIVKRLRDWCEDPHDVSMGELAEYSHKTADEIERLRDEIYNLKLAVAGGEDAPGLANLVGLEDVIMWRKLWTDEIERLRGDKSVLITSFRINMMRLCPDYSHDEFDKDIAAMLKEKE